MIVRLLPSFIFFLLFFPVLTFSQSIRGTFIDCGAAVSSVVNGLQWVPDTRFIETGTARNLTVQFQDSTLSTVRTFPLPNNVLKKFCYEIPVVRGAKHLVRTTYFYGGVNGNINPPVFDQMVDGTFWSVVNTTEDYGQGKASYYEGVFLASGNNLSVCLAANTYTDSDPFISAVQIVLLGSSVYNSTDFGAFALSLVARHSFGYNGPLTRYPDDLFDRYWQPFGANSSSLPGSRNISVSGFWNLPPLKVFQTSMGKNQPEPLQLLWPPKSLPNSIYYIALYLADDRVSTSGSPRVLNITVNGVIYYSNLNVSPAGDAVFANQWPLSGQTNITLVPVAGSTFGPVINAGEVFQILNHGGRTLTRDVIALERLKAGFKNPPSDWNGDPCLPRPYAWTGVTCSGGPRVRVIALNLTSMGISGSLSPYIANMTALSSVFLGNNNLTGSMPDLSPLKRLRALHLNDNQFGGTIPPSLGNNENLREVFLENNNLTGQIPSNLIGKPDLDFRFSGNPLLSPPSS